MYCWKRFFAPAWGEEKDKAIFISNINELENFVDDFSVMGCHYLSREKVESLIVDLKDEFVRSGKILFTNDYLLEPNAYNLSSLEVYHWDGEPVSWRNWNWKTFSENPYAVQCWTLEEALDFADEYYCAMNALNQGIYSVEDFDEFLQRIKRIFFEGIVFDATGAMTEEKAKFMGYKIYQWAQIKYTSDELYTSLRVEDLVPGSLILKGDGIMYVLVELSGKRFFVSKEGKVWFPDKEVLVPGTTQITEDTVLKVYENDWNVAWKTEMINDGRIVIWKN